MHIYILKCYYHSLIVTIINQLTIYYKPMKKLTTPIPNADKQNILLENIQHNSRQNSRRRLKSISNKNTKLIDLQFKSKSKSKSRDRYQYQYQNQDKQNFGETVQLPTFGDWKSQLKGFRCKGKNSEESKGDIDSIIPVTALTQQQQLGQRVKNYEKLRIKQIETQKTLKNKTIFPIENILTKKFAIGPNSVESSNKNRNMNFFTLNLNGRQQKSQKQQKQLMVIKKVQKNRKKSFSIQQSLSQRARALSRQLQVNFQTIDTNLYKIINRKQIFKNLYQKQKQKYQQILRKYHIQETVDDSEFLEYFKQ